MKENEEKKEEEEDKIGTLSESVAPPLSAWPATTPFEAIFSRKCPREEDRSKGGKFTIGFAFAPESGSL